MDLSVVDDTTFVQELKGQDPDDRPLLDTDTAARIIEIFRKVCNKKRTYCLYFGVIYVLLVDIILIADGSI